MSAGSYSCLGGTFAQRSLNDHMDSVEARRTEWRFDHLLVLAPSLLEDTRSVAMDACYFGSRISLYFRFTTLSITSDLECQEHRGLSLGLNH